MKLSKAYEPKKYEDKIYKLWEEQGAFAPKANSDGERFSIVMPPPNANANIHLGTAITIDLEDIAVRYNRLRGKETLFLPGADHAGFETQSVYEKHLAKEGKSRFDFTREELYKQVWDFVQKNKTNYETQFRMLGISPDWDRFTYTLDSKIVSQAYSTFKKMWDEGLVYRGERLVNYCTYHGTGFADIEVEHRTEKSKIYHISYPLSNEKGSLIVATTRPETMFGDVAVAVHSDDERYRHLIGKTIRLPLTNRDIPIVADDMVDIEFGTGAVKITPAHDSNDYEVAERHDLPKMTVIGFDGKMNHEVPEKYRGLDVTDARKAVLSELKELGLLTEEVDHEHQVGHCYKCGTVIQPLLKAQWFINMQPLAKQAIKALNANKITFYPDSKRVQLVRYLEGLRDWNISRQIAWGIPIPAFYNLDDPEDWIYNDKVDEEEITVDGKTYRRDPDVFDTWFSSSSWPYATLGFPDNPDFSKYYPLDLLETGGEILYPWVSRMIMLGLYVTGEIPFKSVYIHGYVMAEDGSKMSKSVGNVIDPIPVINEYGSDALRMGLIAGRVPAVNRGYDTRRVEEARNFCNKLWNTARYIQELVGEDKVQVKPSTPADHWLLTKLQHTTDELGSLLDTYRFAEAYDKFYHFVWDDFADWYLESSKTGPNLGILKLALESILVLGHPFAPFLTEAIWQELGWGTKLVINSPWPTIPKSDKSKAKEFEELMTVITESRSLISAMKLSKPTLTHDSDVLEDNHEVVARMSRLGAVKRVQEGPSSNKNGFQLTSSAIPAWLDVDEATLSHYKDDLHAQLVETEESAERLKSRLNNKGYIASAPEKVVQQTRDQLAEAEAKASQLRLELSRF